MFSFFKSALFGLSIGLPIFQHRLHRSIILSMKIVRN